MLWIFLLILCTSAQAHDSCYSQLWGQAGENWSPAGRLPDFSFAGYMRGEAEIPDMPVKLNVRDFGAAGDGVLDDSYAFIRALDTLENGALYVPEGRYKITKIIWIKKPNIVIRGAGPKKTILYFPIPLNEIEPDWGETTSGRRTSNYAWSGGFLWMSGDWQSSNITFVTRPAKRGVSTLELESTKNLHIGQEIEIYQHDNPDNSLAQHLYSDDAGNVSRLNGSTTVSLVTKIMSIEGARISFDRPLRFDVDPRWNSVIRRFTPTVTNCGIESLGFVFPNIPYEGHFTELGYNPIGMRQVAHCWVRNIIMQNCDSGPFVAAKFCTLSGIVYESERRSDMWTGCAGHHGITFTGDDNLFSLFRFQQRFIHDITVSRCAGNVVMNGSGVDLCFDHHKRAPFENLFTNIDAGEGRRLWKSGGGRALGRFCGARGTLWNIRTERSQKHPGNFAPASINLVALTTDQESVKQLDGRWFEAIPPEKIDPQNLYLAQLQRRLSQDSQP